MTIKDEKINWHKPKVKDLGEAKDLIQNVFKVGTGDSESGMNGILAASQKFYTIGYNFENPKR